MRSRDKKIAHPPILPELEETGKKIVHCAYLVHRQLGPGLLEKVYEACFVMNLRK